MPTQIGALRSRPGSKPKRWTVKKILFFIFIAFIVYIGIEFLLLPSGREFVSENPETSALIEIRASQSRSKGLEPKRMQTWVPIDRISDNLVRAVLGGEDSQFFFHQGFDVEQIQKAVEKNWAEGKIVRGASTITQQLAKNLYLSESKNPLRKLKEAIITRRLEDNLSKRRILELYLNIIEWGDGIYGAEAASRAHLRKSASQLTSSDAAYLAAMIPNPRTVYNPQKNPKRVARRQRLILRRMNSVAMLPGWRSKK